MYCTAKVCLCLQYIYRWSSSSSVKASCERFTNRADFWWAGRLF